MPTSGRRSLLVSQLARSGGQQDVLEELRRAILDGGAPPGTPIPLAEVAEHFGVSAIPVREALKTLVGEKLVAQLTRRELKKIYLVRGVLESAALRAVAEVATDADVQRAAEAHHALEDTIENWDSRIYHRESRRFHLALIAPCGMQRLLHMFESAWNVTEPFQPMRYLAEPERKRLHEDHQAMLTAFTMKDGGALVASSGAHHRRLESVIELVPDDAGLLAEPENI